MLVSQIPGLLDQWYAVARSVDATGGSVTSIELFGRPYVLWVAEGAQPVLTQPYCPHRGAKLAAGTVSQERLVCCYHGWEFLSSGACARIPQLDPGLPIPSKACLVTYPTVVAYGLVWVCVGTPTSPGPPCFAEAEQAGWRVQVDFFEPWATSALRILDNNLDQSHPAFVHQGTFGDPTRPQVPPYELQRTRGGFRATIPQAVTGVGPQMGVTDVKARFQRTQEVELLDPVHTRIRLRYDKSAPDYAFYGSATPISDDRSLYVRVSALEGTEDEQPYAMFWEHSRRITREDQVVLEQMSPDVPLGLTEEVHLRCDRTTIELRRALGALAPRPVGPRLAVPPAGDPTGGDPQGKPAGLSSSLRLAEG